MTIVEALKNLYVAMGGSEGKEFSLNPEAINGIAELVASGAFSGLPDYSEASDGDVLTKEDGEPAWKEPSGKPYTVTWLSINCANAVGDDVAAGEIKNWDFSNVDVNNAGIPDNCPIVGVGGLSDANFDMMNGAPDYAILRWIGAMNGRKLGFNVWIKNFNDTRTINKSNSNIMVGFLRQYTPVE